MLTRAVFAFVLICGLASGANAEEPKIAALGLAAKAVTAEELASGTEPQKPAFNSPAIAYVLAKNLKKGDSVEIALAMDGSPLMRNAEVLTEDKETLLLQAGKTGVPAGGWPEGAYSAKLTIKRDGATLLEKSSDPAPFN